MKRAAALCLLLAALPLCGRVYPQFGVEAFGHGGLVLIWNLLLGNRCVSPTSL